MGKSRVAGVILAAGLSRRWGGEGPKLLARLGGEPLVRRVARAALASRIAEVVAVVGHAEERVRAALGGLDLRVVSNPDHAAGQSTSVRAGLAALGRDVAAAIFLPADQPLLTPRLLDRLIAAHAGVEGRIVVPTAGGRRGAPVLFDRAHFTELARLRGDVGGRKLLPRHPEDVVAVEVEDPRELEDVDEKEDLRRLEQQMTDERRGRL